MVVAAFVGKTFLGCWFRVLSAYGVEGIERFQLIHLSYGEASGIDVADCWERGESVDNVVPLRVACFALTDAPRLCYAEAVLPIGQFKGVVIADVLGHAFLHGCYAFQCVAFGLGIVCDEICHELCGCFNLLAVFLQRFSGRLAAIDFFCQIDVVRLLPDQERTSVGGRLTSPGISHLHPSDALKALALCYLSGHRVGSVVIPI